MAPTAPRSAKVQHHRSVGFLRFGQRVLEAGRGVPRRCLIALQECHDLRRIMGATRFERAGLLIGDDTSIRGQHGEERDPVALEVRLIRLGDIEISIELADGYQDHFVFVEELAGEVSVRSAKIMKFDAPTAPIVTPLNHDSGVVSLGASERGVDATLGVIGLRVQPGFLHRRRRLGRGVLSWRRVSNGQRHGEQCDGVRRAYGCKDRGASSRGVHGRAPGQSVAEVAPSLPLEPSIVPRRSLNSSWRTGNPDRRHRPVRRDLGLHRKARLEGKFPTRRSGGRGLRR